MSNKNIKKEPLMYITQPSSIEPPKVNMQEVFLAKKERAVKEQQELTEKSEPESQVNTKKSRKEASATPDMKKIKRKKIHYLDRDEEEVGVFGTPLKKRQEEETVEMTEEMIDDGSEAEAVQAEEEKKNGKGRSGPYLKRVKSFREMDTEERLDYLVHFPKMLPPVPCLFETKDRSIRGYLVKRSEEEVEVRLFNKKITTVPVNEIESVRIIGMY